MATGRADKIIKLLKEKEGCNVSCSEVDSPQREYYSPMDDSDEDPDFDPKRFDEARGKRKLPPQYFKKSDLENLCQETPKRRRLIDYHDQSKTFPPLEKWETAGLTFTEMTKALENVSQSNLISSRRNLFHESISEHETSKESTPIINKCNNIGENPSEEKNEALEGNASKKRNKTKEKLKLLSPCETSCRKKCFEKLCFDQRKKIFDYFGRLDYGSRQLFFDKFIVKMDVKYRKVDAETNKRFTISYNLPVVSQNDSDLVEKKMETFNRSQLVTESNTAVDEDSEALMANMSLNNMLPVCKTMFLHTLGFKTDGSITSFIRRTMNDMPSIEDRRGKKRGDQMKNISEANYANVKEHIDSYHPQVSHYKLMHAPHRKYLPCDLTIHQMHKDFALKYTPVSYETYRKIFEKENIGFTAPTQDDCSICSIYKKHSHTEEVNKPVLKSKPGKNQSNSNNIAESEKADETFNENPSNNSETCSLCDQYNIHKQRYHIARKSYTEDTTKSWDESFELYAVDMQKILLLPKMTIKNSFFVSRLTVFHETFANLKSKGQNKCILWHEAIKGRNGPDVVSAYYNALIRLNANTRHVIFWADNCTAQNKNWTLFTACLVFVNEDWGPESITFKYFEPGHSFMKADAVHGQIGKKWNKTQEVLDFEDLEKLIKSSNKLNEVISLHAEHFKSFQNGCIQRKKSAALPKLNEMKSVQFKKGSNKLFYKLELEHIEFSEAAVLNPKFKLEMPTSSTDSLPRGINSKKKETIVKELLPHMPPRKQIFWTGLPSSENTEDLGKTEASI